MTPPEIGTPSCRVCRGPLGPDSHPFTLGGKVLFVTCARCGPYVAGAVAGLGELGRMALATEIKMFSKKAAKVLEHPVLRAALSGYDRAKEPPR